MLKVVFDTNIFISAFIFPGGKTQEAHLLSIRRKLILCTSPAIMTELAKTLRAKFGQDEDDIARALKQIARIAEIVKPTSRLKILDDDPDNRVLECAEAAKADLIASNDKHLLRLKKLGDIPIVRATDLLHTIPE